MGRRMLCLYFPSLAMDRLQREDPTRKLRPFAVTREIKGQPCIDAVNLPASGAGIRPGVRLADARTVLPELDATPDDPIANARVKQRFIEWCGRYSPLVADDGFGGIVLDILGCAHLFGGEAAMLQDIQTRIRRSGYRLRGAIAGTLGAAWALARYGKRVIVTAEQLHEALDSLPINALRLPERIISELRRLGITSIAALRGIPRQSLATRYGSEIILRLDQAFGHAEEPIAPYRPPSPYRALRTLAEPVGTVSAVQYVLLDLLKEICARLEREHDGARRLNLDCYRVDGTAAKCCIGTSKPVRSVTHLMRLFSEKLDSLDAGFGIETLVLSVPNYDEFDPEQISFPQFDPDQGDTELDGFIDRLGMRLGFQSVCRFHIQESLLPECSVEFQPVTTAGIPHAIWPDYRVRPVCFIDPPARIEVPAGSSDTPPAQFQFGHRLHRIVRAEGPERLTTEWWRDESQPWESRDYYRVEDDRGDRFWIFQERHPTRWYLRGHFP